MFIPKKGYSEDKGRERIKWSELENIRLNIYSDDKRDLYFEILFIVDKPWPPIGNGEYITDSKMKGIPKPKFHYRSKSFHLASGFSMALPFPFEAQPEECTIEVEAYPKIALSELHLPRYFGEAELRPIRKVFRVIGE